jgi:ribosome biogenesis GTPase
VPSKQTRIRQHNEDRRLLRAVKKQVKRDRKARPVRQRAWKPESNEDWDEMDLAQSERILPRGEMERRKAMWSLALQRLAEDEQAGGEGAHVQAPAAQRGLVVEVSTGLCRVDVDGAAILCSVRGMLSVAESGFTNVVAVGDEVIVSLDGTGRGVVETVLPRRSALTRPDVFSPHLQQVIVANADQLLAVASWRNPALWPELLDHYLIAAERQNLRPLICLNKVDLAQDRRECQAALQPYVGLGYRTVLASALTGEGVPELRELLRGQTTILAGLSGVGKSSLLSAVQPGLNLRIAEVSARRHEGRHTTAQVNLLKLEMGGQVVDTPGIREFGLSGLRRSELVRFYPEISTISGCRYADCSHTHEPGCAVRAALREGRVPAVRYDSYRKIRRSLREA